MAGSIASAASKGDNIAQSILQHIEDQITEKAREIQAKHLEQMTKELADVRKDVVAQAAIRIAKHSSIQYMQDRIVIEIMDRREQ